MGLVEINRDAIGDICEVKMRSLGIFEHTGRNEAHR